MMFENDRATVYKTDIINTICRLYKEYIDDNTYKPNVVYMNYDTFKCLEHECYKYDNHCLNVRNYIFDMEIKIDNSMSNFEILVEREVIMRDDTLDAMRYTMYGLPNPNRLNKPKRYIINKGATILFWEDGTKTIVKRSKNDEYNKRLGFLTAYFQKHCGLTKNQANKYLDNLQDDEDLVNVK